MFLQTIDQWDWKRLEDSILVCNHNQSIKKKWNILVLLNISHLNKISLPNDFTYGKSGQYRAG